MKKSKRKPILIVSAPGGSMSSKQRLKYQRRLLKELQFKGYHVIVDITSAPTADVIKWKLLK